MATSVPELIARQVKIRLGLISTGSGYETTVDGVERPLRIADFSPKNFQIVLTQEDMTENVELGAAGNPPAKAWDLPFRISGMLRPTETSTTPLDGFKNRFQADITKALGVPITGDWAQWEGLAITSNVGTVENDTDNDGSSGMVYIMLTVTFRTDETNLFVNRA